MASTLPKTKTQRAVPAVPKPRAGTTRPKGRTERTPRKLLGHAQPRLGTPTTVKRWTCKNTLGLEVIRFSADFLGIELMPWQQTWLKRALELDGNGNFRFSVVLTLVGRQSGKTTLLKVLTLYMMYLGSPVHGPVRMVLGAAQDLKMARESWAGAVDLARADNELRPEIDYVRVANGEQELRLTNGARYLITAASRSAGRGLSVDLLILDELREHRDWLAWSALSKTTIARPNSLTVAISNAGDDESVVLNQVREAALAGTDPRVAILEWSAPDEADIDDESMWGYGSPALGHTLPIEALRSARATDPPNVFRVEVMCQRVEIVDSAVSPDGWRSCTDQRMTMESVRGRLAVCIDVSPDLQHVTLTAAGMTEQDRVKLAVVDAWDSTDAALAALPGLIATLKPRALAWFPAGPAGGMAADIRKLKGVKLVELTGATVAQVCQEYAQMVLTQRLIHAGDALLTAHTTGATKVVAGDGWRFTRRGGRCDAAYAGAGAVHLARTQPVVGRPRVLVSRTEGAA